MMKIESPVLGTVEVAEKSIIEFPQGLAGLGSCRRFAIVHNVEGAEGLFMLQSLDEPAFLLSVTGPENLGVNYEFSLSDEEVALLQLKKAEDAVVAVILRKAGEETLTPGMVGMTANFMGPLVVNLESRKGVQKVINMLECDVIFRERNMSTDA